MLNMVSGQIDEKYKLKKYFGGKTFCQIKHSMPERKFSNGNGLNGNIMNRNDSNGNSEKNIQRKRTKRKPSQLTLNGNDMNENRL